MKIQCSMTDSEFDLIKNHIDCREWTNPMDEEYIFYYPTERFVLMLALHGIEYYSAD